MSTHLSEIRLEPKALMQWARNIGISSADDGYIVHSLLCAAYGDNCPRPFVLKPGGRGIRILGYSDTDAASLKARREIGADPEVTSCIVSEASKMMPDSWVQGQKIRFEITVAPTRQKARRGGEVDAMSLAPEGASRQVVYTDWLKSRMKGCEILTADLSAYSRMRVKRRGTAGDGSRKIGKGFTIPTATITGVLTVTDPADFSNLIAAGVGRHKAFGFGALLLRPL